MRHLFAARRGPWTSIVGWNREKQGGDFSTLAARRNAHRGAPPSCFLFSTKISPSSCNGNGVIYFLFTPAWLLIGAKRVHSLRRRAPGNQPRYGGSRKADFGI